MKTDVSDQVQTFTMVSYHPSYPPLEMAGFSVRTITNRFENKRLNHRSPWIIDVEANPDSIAQALAKLVREYDEMESMPVAKLTEINGIRVRGPAVAYEAAKIFSVVKESLS